MYDAKSSVNLLCGDDGGQFVGVSQRHEDHPPFERPEDVSVDASETSEEVPTAFPGEAPYPLSDASTAMDTKTEPVVGSGVLEGECR